MSRIHSLLPNPSPEILKPMKAGGGTLQVVWIDQIDAHGLFFTKNEHTSLFATHHNGYSCHELAKRLVDGKLDRAAEQLQFIRDCGGTAKNPTCINLFAP